jgi:hypothetical protein
MNRLDGEVALFTKSVTLEFGRKEATRLRRTRQTSSFFGWTPICWKACAVKRSPSRTICWTRAPISDGSSSPPTPIPRTLSSLSMISRKPRLLIFVSVSRSQLSSLCCRCAFSVRRASIRVRASAGTLSQIRRMAVLSAACIASAAMRSATLMPEMMMRRRRISSASATSTAWPSVVFSAIGASHCFSSALLASARSEKPDRS